MLKRSLTVKIASLLDRLQALIPGMQDRAAAMDAEAGFPQDDLSALAGSGVVAAVLPAFLGGIGWGTEPDGADGIADALRMVGRGSLSVGRLFEAHVNALRLITHYGDPATIAEEVRAGCVFALWVTDPPGDGLRLIDGRLHGRKQFCSGAGHVRRAVVTARDEMGRTRLAVARLQQGATAGRLAAGLSGMRSATTGEMLFDGVRADPFGAPDDYLREPDFSAGAWRTSAVTLGGLEALVAAAIYQLRQRGRTGDAHQQARIGRALIAEETARLWVRAAGRRAEAADGDPADVVAYVNLARLAVEQACLEAMQLVQRSLGVAAFLRPNPVERICRDLSVYLRQPAPDEALTEAAARMMRS